MLINFIMLITYANKLCKLMSGQIDKMSDQNEDLQGHVLLKKKNYFQPCIPHYHSLIIGFLHSLGLSNLLYLNIRVKNV